MMHNSSVLLLLIVILMAGGILAWVTGKFNKHLPAWISLFALFADLVLLLPFLIKPLVLKDSQWIAEFSSPWIPVFGISFHLAMDGLSLLMLALTIFTGIISVIISWNEIKFRVGFFHFNIMWILAGIIGVFLSLDLFLFYFCWEVMLIPMYFLIGIWGHENRIYASYKFFIFTQASGLLMFLSIIGLFLIHGYQTGNYTFDYTALLGTTMSARTEFILMSGFLMAFIVKLPVVPFHTWLPDAHTEAPTAGSVILAALMLKTGAYGLLRFVVPLFPHAAASFAYPGMILGVIGILYGAKLAYAQTDLKRLVAYTSVSHMGFIMLGVFAFNEMAYQGVVFQMIAHGITTGALFIMVGQLYERLHTRDMNKMGGLWENAPVLGTMGLIFSMGSLGLPALGNFIAEFLTLAGTFKANMIITSVASAGLIAATIYSLRIMQKIFYGEKNNEKSIRDLSFRELIVMVSLVVVLFYMGLFPQRILNTSKHMILKTLVQKEQILKDNK